MNIHKTSIFILLFLVWATIGFGKSSTSSIDEGSDMADTTVIYMRHTSVVDTIVEDSVILADDLSQFECVLDTLNSSGDRSVHSQYFLFDITGDGQSELWIKSGSCEADYRLMAYTLESGNPRKIYEGEGGHSDFFIYNEQLVCVICNTGAGLVITYGYDGKQVVDSMVEFSTWNEDGTALSAPHDSIADEKLEYWEDSYENYIELKPL